MKTIKKTNWLCKFVDFTFEEMPKTTCGFIQDILLSIILLPLTCHTYFIYLFLGDSIKDDNKVAEKEMSKWSWVGLQTLLLVCNWFVSTVLCAIIISSYYSSIKTLNGDLISLFTLWSLPGMFIFPPTIYFFNKACVYLKVKFCQPITFID